MSATPGSNPCADPITCPGGNCVGCVNGKLNCRDSRCDPNCAGCQPPPNLDFAALVLFVIIIIVIGALIIIVSYVYLGFPVVVAHDDAGRADVIVPGSKVVVKSPTT